jgi:hypothetical protein
MEFLNDISSNAKVPFLNDSNSELDGETSVIVDQSMESFS